MNAYPIRNLGTQFRPPCANGLTLSFEINH